MRITVYGPKGNPRRALVTSQHTAVIHVKARHSVAPHRESANAMRVTAEGDEGGPRVVLSVVAFDAGDNPINELSPALVLSTDEARLLIERLRSQLASLEPTS